ncbi:putative Methyltransferase-like protein 22 [Hypsibius exemplaris]|uniref:Methyltransferase-like protein 22 n=1 Tax=Hypsibius exemplaris TaxID=2072580 RepID=A0A9X6RLG2_HYPEX|nr:putative Methyltransferase-like protein 22 [Hypsibius exemplaris]
MECDDDHDGVEYLTKFVPLDSDEHVLSDVHINCSSAGGGSNSENVISRFVFTVPNGIRSCNHLDKPNQSASYFDGESTADADDEEDSQVERRDLRREVILIEHTMATVLEDVGTQVWRGALYLCDFILGNPILFAGQTVLELGAGVGLVSALLNYIGSSRTFCTDHSTKALTFCQGNIIRNQFVCLTTKSSAELGPGDAVSVRCLDWFDKSFPKINAAVISPFSWAADDIDVLRRGFVVVAADVIYSDDLTDAFLTTLLRLSEQFRLTVVAYVALEKRLNFTLEDLAVCSPPYRYFQRKLCELSQTIEASTRALLMSERLPDNFPQCFQYERVPELEVWKITATINLN